MMAEQTRRTDIVRQAEEFERQNPKVAEAMRLFEMTMTQYRGALNALSGPRVYQSDTTAPYRPEQHGELE